MIDNHEIRFKNFNYKIFNTVTRRNYPEADDMSFSLIANLELISRVDKLSPHGMLEFHKDFESNALYRKPGVHEDHFALFKKLYQQGYVPVIQRPSYKESMNSPEKFAIQNLKPLHYKW